MAYATPADLSTWTSNPAPADATRQLARAALEIDYALMGARYAVDINGLPTDATVIAALRDASTAQVEWWMVVQDEVSASDNKSRIEATDQNVNTKDGPGGRPKLAPRAGVILRLAKLLPAKAVV